MAKQVPCLSETQLNGVLTWMINRERNRVSRAGLIPPAVCGARGAALAIISSLFIETTLYSAAPVYRRAKGATLTSPCGAQTRTPMRI